MDKFLEVVGALIVIVTMLAMCIVQFYAGRGNPAGVLLGMLVWGLPSIVGGVIIAAFGQMLGQLKAIRYQAEKQNLALDLIASKFSGSSK